MFHTAACFEKIAAGLLLFESGGSHQRLQADVVQSWQVFAADAGQAGFEPVVVSGFRSPARQQALWNAKVNGSQPVYDDAERIVDLGSLSNYATVEAIMRFSAIPGLSRHHWGTDLDIFDQSAQPAGYQVRLRYSETQGDGVCAAFYRWLDAYETPEWAFSRPYRHDSGGVAVEPWHLSHHTAAPYEAALTLPVARRIVERQSFLLRDTVLQHFDEFYERFVVVAV